MIKIIFATDVEFTRAQRAFYYVLLLIAVTSFLTMASLLYGLFFGGISGNNIPLI